MPWNHLAIESVMTRTPVVVAPEDLLAEAQHAMLVHRVRHLPVVTAGRVVGVVSQRDVYDTKAHRDEDKEVVRVADAMSPFVYVVGPKTPVEEVARDLADAKYGAAVVGVDDKPIGVFTTTDALALLADVLADLRRQVHTFGGSEPANGRAAGSRTADSSAAEPIAGER